MSKFRIVFIHGYTSSSKADWYPGISKKLKGLGVDFVIPNLPGNEHPKASDWLKVINKEVSKSDKPLVLVGHSLGTRAALLYIEKYRREVEKVFLISAFNNDIENGKRREGKAYPTFFDHKIDLEAIKPLVGEFVVVHSKDDVSKPPFYGIDYKQGVEIAGELNAKLITTKGRGHLDIPDNMPYILDVLREHLKF